MPAQSLFNTTERKLCDDKYSRKIILMLGFILFLVISIIFIFNSNSLIMITILFALYGVVNAMTLSNQKALVSDFAGNTKGTAMGFYYFVIGLVSIVAGLIAGILWDISPQTMFTYIAGVTVVAIILLCFVEEN